MRRWQDKLIHNPQVTSSVGAWQNINVPVSRDVDVQPTPCTPSTTRGSWREWICLTAFFRTHASLAARSSIPTTAGKGEGQQPSSLPVTMPSTQNLVPFRQRQKTPHPQSHPPLPRVQESVANTDPLPCLSDIYAIHLLPESLSRAYAMSGGC